MRSTLVLLLLLVALPASAADRDTGAEAVAQEANRVRDELCSAGADADTTLAAKSLSEVTRVWAEVSEELDRSRKVYLLYWRGVLGQCLSQEERAIDDLRRFVQSQDGRNLWQSLVDDAKLRLQRLIATGSKDTREPPPPPNPGGVVGVFLAGGAGASGGLAYWQWANAEAKAQEMYATPHTGDDLLALGAEGDQFQLTSRILVGTAAGLGTAAVISWIVGGATGGSSSRQAALMPSFAVLPAPQGATLVLAGRW